MNLEEIKQEYLREIKNKTTSIILNINRFMIDNYIQIEKNKQIEITENEINGNNNNFGSTNRDAIIEILRKSFKKDWDIESSCLVYNINIKSLIFTLKTDVQEKLKITTIKPEPINNRSEILDL